MKIVKIDKNNQVNGEGLRCVVWVSGCTHNCEDCHNPETHDYNFGHEITEEEKNIIMEQLLSDEISGVTLTGGDPFFPLNQGELTELCKWMKSIAPFKQIGCYTGFKFEEIKQTKLIWYIDVLIDGKYDKTKNPGLGKTKGRGSTNQRIIDVKKSLWSGIATNFYNENDEEE